MGPSIWDFIAGREEGKVHTRGGCVNFKSVGKCRTREEGILQISKFCAGLQIKDQFMYAKPCIFFLWNELISPLLIRRKNRVRQRAFSSAPRILYILGRAMNQSKKIK